MNIPKKEPFLPLKIEDHEVNLRQTKDELQKFAKLSDGLIFKKVGLDALIGIIPIAGGIYTGLAGVWLLFQSNRVRARFQEKMLIIFLTFVDIVIGVFVGIGDALDAFFRVHTWTSERLIVHIDTQLSLIERTREQLNQGLETDLGSLEDILFRHGRGK